ncbi:flagellar hook-length control protein FliK [Mesorhizobium sp. M0488]|uniref:flagellar hook-length control protein FliK n=1 Tax=unclassified Mesorhizobium TaxID=325217 RepID=UPI0033377FC6
MTPSLGQALPGFTVARSSSEQPGAAGKNDEAGFGKMLHGSASHPEKQPATETGARDQRLSKLAAGLAAREGEDEPVPAGKPRAAPAGSPPARPMKDAKDAASGKDTDADTDTDVTAAEAGATPLQDHLPLLIALHDLRHFSTSGKSANASEGGPDAAVDGKLLPTAYRMKSAAGYDDLEPVSKSERAAIVDGALTKLESVRDAASGTPGRDPAAATSALLETKTAEVPGVEPKQAMHQPRSIADVQSSLRSEAGKQLSAERIDVVSERSFPAPPQVPMSQAALSVIGAITADGGPRQALSTASATAQLAGPVAVPTHVLKIELHPAELGMVTAHLRLAGEQLSIELKPETHDAYRRLSSDSEAIVKSLRGLGFEVDKVTIMQPGIAVLATTRADATASQAAAPGREQSSFQPGNSGGGNGGQQPGQQSTRGSHDDAQDYGRAASPSRERAGGDIFI